MIDYKRANWYGWSYLLTLHGSVIPKSAPIMIVSGILGAWAASPSGIAALYTATGGTGRHFFGETYGVQIFGLVFGYLCIARLNICCACAAFEARAPRPVAAFSLIAAR